MGEARYLEQTLFGFEIALEALKDGRKVAREGFRETCYVVAQFPDEHSVNTEPYLAMVKGDKRFPVDLSCESLFAKDWKLVE